MKVKTQNEVLTILKNHREAVNGMMDETAEVVLMTSKLPTDERKEVMVAMTEMAEMLEKNSDQIVTMGIGIATMREELKKKGFIY